MSISVTTPQTSSLDTRRPVAGARRAPARPARRLRSDVLLVWCFLLPSIVVFVLYRILPLVWNVVMSFQHFSLFGGTKWAGLSHYVEMWNDEVFWASLGNTLIFLASAPVGIVLALAIALMLNSEIRGRNIYRTVVFLSYPLMTVAVGIIWRWLYDEKVGLFNYALRTLGLIDQPIPFLQSFELALPSVLVANIWQILGFYMIILLAGLQNIPANVYEAAAIDGANAWQIFFRITLPLLRPAMFLAFVVGVMTSFTSFDLVYVMTQGGPGHSTELLVTYIYKAAFQLSKVDYAAALTVVQFALLVTLTWLGNRWSGGEAGSNQKA
ncbi:carbohydrate ABC transporter permease [Variovorax sp. OV329]|uniref:carbohydrate ABC transporter permease n=1 Tax=Variovorax sp. OV329 TaxID=1882825 RepID=UPI0008E6E569|nr:sugar ABC transporter permease [Variovorax sp. OV329]SFN52267.1 carbohydrate ABC transporter membrane protein 1, CUT1 family [Variovorax sp. OV329]